MPTRDTAPAGHPCWIDLMTGDLDASRAFYGDLFGWASEVGGPEFGGYTTFTKDGIAVAGAMDKNANPDGGDMPDAWSTYLKVDDAAATQQRVEAAGGTTLVAPMEIPTVGVMAFYQDPDGAAIGAWQPKDFEGMGVLVEPDTPGWFELFTRDFHPVLAFYEEAFDWTVEIAGDTDEFRYATLEAGEAAAAGVMDASAFLPEGVPSHWSVYFSVADADASIERAVGLGATVVVAAEDTPYGRLATLTDPTGAVFKLIGPSAEQG